MAHLTDMEELLASIKSSLIQDYMREAMNCYMASAYRGCIVLSYIALFDDIYDKLGELSKVNSAAKTIYDEAKKKKSNQDVYESYLIDQLGSKGLLSALDTTFLGILRDLRNKSAHPSGHKPLPEEARYIFAEVINRFLSKPILSTTQLVDDLILRLVNTNFFAANSINDIKEVVKEEIALLHEEAFPYLVSKLSESTSPTDTTFKENAFLFLLGLARLDIVKANEAIQTKVIQRKCDDPVYAVIILCLISCNPKLITGITDVCLSRIRAIIINTIDNYTGALRMESPFHPIQLFISLASYLDDDDLLEKFENQLRALINRYYYSPSLIRIFDNHPKAFEIYFSIILEKARSYNFATANNISHSLIQMDEFLSTQITEKQSLELIIAIDIAANWGAIEADRCRENNYTSIPQIKQKAITFYTDNKDEAMKVLNQKFENNQENIANCLSYLEIEIETE